MTKILSVLTLAVSLHAAPSVSVVRTGWEKIRRNVYVYYGPETQRDQENVYLTEPIGTVRKSGSIWMYQIGRYNAMIPAMDKQTAVYAVEKFTESR